jgi:spore coat polysaccharide biosynthesis predicted glycosyltransferase SpsG
VERGLTCHFLGQFDDDALTWLANSEFPVEVTLYHTGDAADCFNTGTRARDLNAVAVVVDSYVVGSSYIANIDRIARVLVIDDFGRLDAYNCWMVLNFTLSAVDLAYPHGPARLLLGPRYLLVRHRLRSLRPTVTVRDSDVRRVLVAIAGVDRHDISALAVSALRRISNELIVRVIAGAAARSSGALERAVSGAGRCEVVDRVSDLGGELEHADVCICGGGLTKYEAAYLGVPVAIIGQTDDQAADAALFAARALGVNLGLWNEISIDSMEEALTRLFTDRAKRANLSRMGLATFPSDPTGAVAASLADELTDSARISR